jgi:hypothetical protein
MQEYNDYDFDNPQEYFRYERDEAIRMVPGANPEALLFALEIAWLRGHNAGTKLGWSEAGNVYRRPPAGLTTYTPEYKKLIWPFIEPEVDTQNEKD